MIRAAVPNVEAILDTIIDAIIVIDEAGVIRSANSAVEKIFGYKPRELMGKNVSVLMPEPYRRKHNGYIQNYLRTGQAKIIGLGREVVAKRKDGTVFPVHLGVNEGGKKGGRSFFTGIIRDITEIKRAGEDLKRQQEFTAAVLNTVGSLVLVLDRKGRIVNFNRACEETTGYSFQEVAGKPFWDFFLSKEDRAAVVKNFLRTDPRQLVNNFEAVWLTKKGEKRLIAWSNSLLSDEKNSTEHVIGTGIDITERRHLEHMVLEIAKEEQRRLGQELHDGIAQHLASTAIMAKVLEQKLMRGSAPAARDLKRVVAMVNQAVTQTRELAQGLYVLDAHSEGLIASLKKLAQYTERTLGIRCAVLIRPNAHRMSIEASAHLYRIAREAVGNAVKHGRGKNIRIELKKKNAHRSELRIENDGKRFSVPPRNKGLGLSMMRSRAAMLNAILEVTPGSRGGTVVRCVFQGRL